MNNKKIVASIEARMGSSRLPGKVLENVCGASVLDRLLARLNKSKHIDQVILATTKNKTDDILARWAKDRNLFCFRGSEDDVLSRVVQAHAAVRSDIIVELTGDCPLTDPTIIDWGIETFQQNNCDIVTNCRLVGFPEGADLQVFNFKSLQWVDENILDAAVREHVSLYFYENPEKYKIIHMVPPEEYKHPGLRLQVDYEEDLQFVRRLVKHFTGKENSFGVVDIVKLLKDNPDFIIDNKNCSEKEIRSI